MNLIQQHEIQQSRMDRSSNLLVDVDPEIAAMRVLRNAKVPANLGFAVLPR